MAAMVARPPDIPSRNPTPPPTLALNTTFQGTPAPVPNKHLPFCSPGPTPTFGLPSPPASPPSKEAAPQSHQLLHPPDQNSQLSHDPPVYAISASTLADALDQTSNQPLPPTSQVFPWLHGLHEDNQMQLAFFAARRTISRKVPRCLRGLTIVKAGANLNKSRLKGSISAEELLPPLGPTAFAPCFQDADPRMGFSVRNFQIQTCKMAAVSDIVVYGDDSTPLNEVEELAKLLSIAQTTIREEADLAGSAGEMFSTFVVTDPFHIFEANHRETIAVDSAGNLTGHVTDFLSQERLEMCGLSRASEIAPNVWLGPSPDTSAYGPLATATTVPDEHYDVMIEASDVAAIPSQGDLDDIESFLGENVEPKPTVHLEFPSSGSFAAMENGSQSDLEVESILRLLHWIHDVSRPMPAMDQSQDEAHLTRPRRPRRVLIHCQDGYTESTLLSIAYFMFAFGLSAHEAWIRLHTSCRRNFFAYPTDKFFLENIQLLILAESPALQQAPVLIERPLWMRAMDGSLPSRILPYLYLGNLNHAQNPTLLRHLGITRVLSVGEPINWPLEEVAAWGVENLMFIDKVQDNGVDPLTSYFPQCLDFIAGAKEQEGATLVHCRVGVSRSATICIAEVMSSMNLSFPRAYCFVRARRLNVIIQPHLRFTYELMKYEEELREKRGMPIGRELEWATVAREIAAMNRPYCRQ